MSSIVLLFLPVLIASPLINRDGRRGKAENETGCDLPEQPKGGSYEIICSKLCSKRPGAKVPIHSLLIYKCQQNYVLNGTAVPRCTDVGWSVLPTCLKTCPPLRSSSVNILCTYRGNIVSCGDRIRPGIMATLSCKPAYKLPVTNDPGYRTITCLEDGLWDRRLFRCLPECGTPIANGYTNDVGTFPWHVSVYKYQTGDEYQQICGGTLISSNLVISAAHCFYDETNNKLDDKSRYIIAAGKFEHDLNAYEKYVQKSIVEEILLPESYHGLRSNYASDIAVVKLATPFQLTAIVQPICIDWDNVYEWMQLRLGESGKTVGWRKIENNTLDDTLKVLTMPYIPYDQCSYSMPVDFRAYITSDKFCAGRLNGSGLCHGDSGGGLIFEMNGLWYLRGIVSVSPLKDSKCISNAYTVFTSTDYFREWIRAVYVFFNA